MSLLPRQVISLYVFNSPIKRRKCTFFFYWRIIAWQCCVGFCCTTMWIHWVCIYIPSLLSSLLRSSQITELSSPCYTTASHELCILYMVVNICQCYSLNSLLLHVGPNFLVAWWEIALNKGLWKFILEWLWNKWC